MSTFFDIAVVLIATIIIYGILIYLYNHKPITADKRIAIDYLPFPVYWGLDNRLPLVVNDKMYEMIYNLSGQPLTDMKNGFNCLYNNRLIITDTEKELSKKYNNSFFIAYNDQIYCIEEKLYANSNSKNILINGQNISDEYNNLHKLIELNNELKSQNERLQLYIRNSIDINYQQELLDAKISIHGKFGDCIAMTRHLLKHPDDVDLRKKIPGLWKQIVIGYSQESTKQELSQKGYEELQRVSRLVGCNILIDENMPEGEIKTILIKIIREALNNSIRHANATSLTVELKDLKSNGNVIIYDNGIPQKQYEKPGGGLSSLIASLEKSGIILTICPKPRFEIHLHFPEQLRH